MAATTAASLPRLSLPPPATLCAATSSRFRLNLASVPRRRRVSLRLHRSPVVPASAASSPSVPSSSPEPGSGIGDALGGVAIFSAATGEPVLIRDLWDQNEGMAVVALLRHFGCPCCWELALTLKETKERFDAAGVKLIAVGVGTPDKARILAERIPSLDHSSKDVRHLITTGKHPTTTAIYKLISDRGERWDQAKWIWLKPIPKRHRIFLWLAFRARLNTGDNMTKKCWTSDAGCGLCPAMETVHHIALHCRSADSVWQKLQLHSRALRASSISEFLEATAGGRDKAWPVCFGACLLNLWKARNDRIFNQKTTTPAVLLTNIRLDLELWATRSHSDREDIQAWAQRFQT